jgi:hypothetical protein
MLGAAAPLATRAIRTLRGCATASSEPSEAAAAIRTWDTIQP